VQQGTFDFPAVKDIGVEINTQKTVCKFICLDQNAEQNHNIKTVTKPFENVTGFKYLGTVVTTQNFTHKEAEQNRFKKSITLHVFCRCEM
jgi:aminopeptidase C